MENNFKRKLMAFWLFLWVGIPFMLAQSPMMISGRITDDLGEPMIGVSVLEKGTSNGVITNMEGNYSLKVKQGAVIVYSYACRDRSGAITHLFGSKREKGYFTE